MSHVTTPLAILVGSIIIAAAVMGGNLINRYRVELWQSPHVLRLDTVTGEVCLYNLFTQTCAPAR